MVVVMVECSNWVKQKLHDGKPVASDSCVQNISKEKAAQFARP
jgi:hypothetical protein